METLVENWDKGYYINPYILIYSAPVILYHLHYLLKGWIGALRYQYTEAVVYGSMLFLIITNSGSPSAFVYFQF